MNSVPLSLSSHLSRRIEKLAAAAGRSPASMLRYVIRDGLEYCEYAVKAVNQGLADIEAGRVQTSEQLKAHFEKRRAARRGKKAA
mgnify:CR=1 FL=1